MSSRTVCFSHHPTCMNGWVFCLNLGEYTIVPWILCNGWVMSIWWFAPYQELADFGWVLQDSILVVVEAYHNMTLLAAFWNDDVIWCTWKAIERGLKLVFFWKSFMLVIFFLPRRLWGLYGIIISFNWVPINQSLPTIIIMECHKGIVAPLLNWSAISGSFSGLAWDTRKHTWPSSNGASIKTGPPPARAG